MNAATRLRCCSAALAMTLAITGGACSMLPKRSELRAAPSDASRLAVHGAAGQLSPMQEQRTVKAVAADGRDDLLGQQLKALTSTGDVDLYRGNQARLLIDGPATFAAMKAAIGSARTRILLESYIVEDEGVAAEVGELLLSKAAEGVRVAMIYDAVGSISTPQEYFERLAAGGVAICEFNPVNPVRRLGRWGISQRDHRKLLVVDDDVAFTGGMNISRVYGSSSSFQMRRRKAAKPLEDGWRDTQIAMRGPVVPALARIFDETWRSQGCEGDLPPAQRRPAGNEPGERMIKLVVSDPDDETNRIYTTMLAAIEASQRSVQLTMAYFAPGQDFVDALCDAARRGVDVELVLPGRSDFALVLHAGHSYYQQMLDAGIKLHEMDDAMMHAKTAVIDGVFSTVGSSNLDWRSLASNYELNVIVLGEDFGSDMQRQFDKDRAASTPIEAASWRRRGLRERTLELVGRVAERWL
jgi:cardiolipin synthase